MLPKRKASSSPPPTNSVFRSAPITDRLSTFVGLFSPTLSARELQADRMIADASHRMAAWRRPSKQRVLSTGPQPPRQIFETGYDDDGEQYAGKKLEKLLDTMQVEGSVVVARWYGGVMLGPVRFTHIETCARNAVLQTRAQNAGDGAPPKLQKREEEDDQARKAKLERVLEQRDQSISSLRLLLAEKKAGASNTTPTSSPVKQLSYSKMPLPALLKLEKARDATIGWLLQEIDKAEQASKNTTEAQANGETSLQDPGAADLHSAVAALSPGDDGGKA